MTLEEIAVSYMNLLYACFLYDVAVYKQAWLYIVFFIPAIFYTVFFFFKWILLTLPLWLPLRMILMGVARVFKEIKS